MHLPFDLWTKRLPRKFQENGPRVVQRSDGTRQWVVEGRPWSGVGWSGLGWGSVSCYARAGVAEEPEPAVAQVMTSLAQRFADERRQLETPMKDEAASTENLRVALQHYRSFFQRLLTA